MRKLFGIKTRGELTFWRIGRLGGSFYFARG